MDKNTEEEKLAIKSLHNFIQFFNEKDKDKILNCLHYPHMAQSENNDPKIYSNKEEMWGYIGFLLKKLETEENWHETTLDKVEVINCSENAIQCNVEFNRRYENKESFAKAVGIWTATKKQGKWGLQLRTMIPVSGKISILAGGKID
tara:strand:+ start:65 stop:505 length:441 start_codon:yes stop_codon:yes gene_type:complete